MVSYVQLKKMALKNQGYRKDLNLSETENDRVALSNLGGTGIGDDLTRIVNNLRNVDHISFHQVANGQFSFESDINIGISSIYSDGNTRIGTQGQVENISVITVMLSNSYRFKVGDLVTISGPGVDGEFPCCTKEYDQNETLLNENVNADLFFTGTYSIISISDDFTEIKLHRAGSQKWYREQNVTNVNCTVFGRTDFTYTKDDVVYVDKDVTIKVVDSATPTPNVHTNFTLSNGTPYYICESDGLSKFSLSTRPSDHPSGLNILKIHTATSLDNEEIPYTAGLTTSINDKNIDATNLIESFSFTRNVGVHQSNVIQLIEPDKQDDSFSYGVEVIVDSMDNIQSNNAQSAYYIAKKYKGNEDTITDDEIKTQGSMIMNDPIRRAEGKEQNWVTNYANGPGMYINATRAFSTDNNPWDKFRKRGEDAYAINESDPDSLRTYSNEVAIGELYFGDKDAGPVLSGGSEFVSNSDGQKTGLWTTSSQEDPNTFTHKFPVEIVNDEGNIETYYVLLKGQ